MTQTLPFTRSNAPSSLGAAQLERGATAVLFLSKSRSSFRADQAREVHAVCMSSFRFIDCHYGANDVAEIRQCVGA